MRHITFILLVGSYLLALVINLMPSIKYPDASIGLLNMFVTIVFIVLLLVYSQKGSKFIRVFSILGGLSGLIVFIITSFEQDMIGNGVLDLISSIQYPFYVIFITPLFGGNMLINLTPGIFALLMTLVYGVGIVVGFNVYSKAE
ncbi:hypothetical protein [Oceanobacillus kapialis]|uniref:hypothetical protein n=1 Tax=Oceanobacillus kapialis TaxID=481353 RepID=UPI00384B3FEE